MTFFISATCPHTGHTYSDRICRASLTEALVYTRKNYPHPWIFEIWQHTGATNNV